MKLIVKQKGGLGNQLFQFAAGLYLSQKHNCQLRIATLPTSDQTDLGHPRPVLLDQFSISAPINEWNRRDRLTYSRRRQLQTLSAIYRAAAGVAFVNEPVSRYFTYYDPPIPSGTRTAYLDGYWQSARMVQATGRRLRDQLVFRNGPTDKNREMAQAIGRAKFPISLHLRRGDYAKITYCDAVLPIEYYERAVSECRSTWSDATFFVFSDAPTFAREWTQSKPNMILVENNNEETAAEDLRLMSLCKAHIIANSTFSWWGAWLNPRDDKHVIAPPTWLGQLTRNTDLIPVDWTILD